MSNEVSDFADPLAVLPHRLERGQVARVKNIFGGGDEVALFQVVERIAGADGDELQHARISVAVNHALGAAVADELGIVPVPDLAHRLVPRMAAVEVEIPVEVKIFVAAEAAEFFLFAAQVALHFIERFGRVHHGIPAVLFHLLDFFKQLNQLLLVEIHQAAVAETQIAARQRRERIAERAAFETERFQKVRKFFIVFNQPAGRDAGGRLDADGMKKFVRLLDFFADVRQAAIFFVRRDVVRVNGHDDAGQPVAREAAHVFIIPQTAVRADHGMNSAFRRVARHRSEIAMHHRFAADEKEIADVIFYGDVHDAFRFIESDTASCLGIKLRTGKAAKAAVRIANVRDRELQVTRPAMLQHFLEEF